MKITALLFLLSISSFAQDLSKEEIVGVWQRGDTLVGEGYLETYQFFNDGRFVYNFSQMEDVGRIRSLHGRYRLQNEVLFTKIDYRMERVGGIVRRGDLLFQDEWALDSTKTKIIKQPESEEEYYSLKVIRAPSMRFLIRGLKRLEYWKISNDPRSYH